MLALAKVPALSATRVQAGPAADGDDATGAPDQDTAAAGNDAVAKPKAEERGEAAAREQELATAEDERQRHEELP